MISLEKFVPAIFLTSTLLLAQSHTNPKESAASTAKLTSHEKTFIREVAEAGHLQVMLGKLAEQRAESSAVKSFGQRMIDDHTKVNEKLDVLAKEKGVALPAPSASPKAEQQLSKLKGAAFDRAYMKDMVRDHEHDVAAFQAQAKSATDPQLRSFVNEALPVLQEHLAEAKSIEKDLEKKPQG
jgi:putative membrane protein